MSTKDSVRNLEIDESSFQELLENIPSMIGYWDSKLINQFSNSAYRSYFGKTKNQIKGKHLREVIGDVLYEANLPYITSVLKGMAQQFERSITLPNGEVKHTQVFYTPHRRDEEVRGFFVFVNDVTTLKTAQLQLAQFSKMAALGEMAGGIAHEINNPLAIIALKAALLRYEFTNKEHKEATKAKKALSEIDTITDTVERISRIIKGLMVFARQSQNDAPQLTKVELLVQDALSFCAEKFKAHGVQLIVSEIDPSVMLKCRSVEISQVLINLLNNAFDAVSGEKEKWIKLSVKTSTGKIEFSVEDSGSGIPLEIREKIMQPFFTTKAIGKGTGLGLSISKGIIEGHAGILRLDPDAANTRFVFTIPH